MISYRLFHRCCICAYPLEEMGSRPKIIDGTLFLYFYVTGACYDRSRPGSFRSCSSWDRA